MSQTVLRLALAKYSEKNALKNSAGTHRAPGIFPDCSEETAASISSFVMGSFNLILL